jgi:hypothetical protein
MPQFPCKFTIYNIYNGGSSSKGLNTFYVFGLLFVLEEGGHISSLKHSEKMHCANEWAFFWEMSPSLGHNIMGDEAIMGVPCHMNLPCVLSRGENHEEGFPKYPNHTPLSGPSPIHNISHATQKRRRSHHN